MLRRCKIEVVSESGSHRAGSQLGKLQLRDAVDASADFVLGT